MNRLSILHRVRGRGLLGLCVGGLVGLGPLAARAQSEACPPAAEIIEHSINAQGGRAAFEKLKSRTMQGSFEFDQAAGTGRFTIHEAAPSRRHSVMESAMTGRMVNGTDGEVCWQMSPLGPRVLDGAEQRLCLRQARFNAALHWKELYEKAECTGVEEVDGQRCYRVAMTPPGGNVEVTYYDCETWLPRKSTMVVDGPLGKMELEQKLEEYRRVDGVLLPHRVRQLNRTFGRGVVIRFERIEHNTELPKDIFEPPEAVQKLLQRPDAATSAPAR